MRRPVEEPEYAERAARALREEASRLSATPSSIGDRAASVALIEQALRARARRRMAPWLGAAAAVAALVVLGVVALRPTRHPGMPVSVARQGQTAPHAVPQTAPGTMPAGPASHPRRCEAPAWLTVAWSQGAEVSTDGAVTRRAVVGDAIVPGASLRAPADGNLTLSSTTGTEVRLRSASALRVESLGTVQKLRLEAGQVRAAVAKLLPGERFLIETPDAEVEVRGTRFEVAITGAGALPRRAAHARDRR